MWRMYTSVWPRLAVTIALPVALISTSVFALPENQPSNVGYAQHLQVLVNGEAGFLKKIDLIKRAKSELNIAYFIFEDDFTAAYMAEQLIEKSRTTKIRLLVDHMMTEKYASGTETSLRMLPYLAGIPNIEVRRFRDGSPEFKLFMRDRFKMQDPEAFIRGLSLQDPKQIEIALASSETIAAKMGPLKEALNEFRSEADPKLRNRKAMEAIVEFMFTRMLMPDAQNNEQPQPSGNLLTRFGRNVGRTLVRVRDAAADGKEFREHLRTFMRRMHHKIMISQTERGSEFLVGGRNISDEYHVQRTGIAGSAGEELLKGRSYPFVDSEISGVFTSATAGGRTLEKTFIENLWTAPEAAAVKERLTSAEQSKLRAKIRAKAARFEAYLSQYQVTAAKGVLSSSLAQVPMSYFENAAPADLKYKNINAEWHKQIAAAKKRVVMISAYFNFYPEMIEAIKKAVTNGATVEIYTNSPGSTDMNMVNFHSYQSMEHWLSQLGDKRSRVTIHELGFAPGQGSLHVKAIQIDDKILGVGSCNADPRSYLFDTNNMVFVQDSGLAMAFVDAYLKRFKEFSDMGNLPWYELTLEKARELLGEAVNNGPTGRMWILLNLPDIKEQL